MIIKPGIEIEDRLGEGTPPPLKMKVTWVTGDWVGLEWIDENGNRRNDTMTYQYALQLLHEQHNKEVRTYPHPARGRKRRKF